MTGAQATIFVCVSCRRKRDVLPEASKDSVLPEASKDSVLPEASKDSVLPEASKDSVLPEASKDSVLPEASKDSVLPEASKDSVLPEASKDSVLPEASKDSVLPEASKDSVLPEASKDSVLPEASKDSVLPEASKDSVLPEASKDSVLPEASKEENASEGFDLPGADLATALEAEVQRTGAAGLTVTPVECLAVCKRPCTVALVAQSKWTYLVGDLDPAEHVQEIVAAAMAFARSESGIVPWKERPQTFRSGVISRIPPLGFVQPKPETP